MSRLNRLVDDVLSVLVAFCIGVTIGSAVYALVWRRDPGLFLLGLAMAALGIFVAALHRESVEMCRGLSNRRTAP